MTSTAVTRLTLALAVVYGALGTLEVVLKVREDAEIATILFFGGTLLSGAALILCGLAVHASRTAGPVLVMLGAVTGLLASAWTLLVPLLAIAVVVTNAQRLGPVSD